jgi:hypothetical protein
MQAFLSGQQGQRQLTADKMAAQAQNDERMDRMMKAATAYKKEQAKALAETNARAQMGDVVAMQNQVAAAHAANKPPDQKMLEDMSGMLNTLPAGKARDALSNDFKAYAKEYHDEQEKQKAIGIIDQSVEDGHMDPEEAEMLKLQSPQEGAQKAVDIRKERAAGNMAMEDSALAIEQAEVLLQAANKNSDGAKLAKNTLELFKDSPSSQKKPGEAAKMLKAMKDALVRGAPNVKAPSHANLKQRLSGPVVGQGGTDLETVKTNMQEQRPEDTFSAAGYAPYAKKQAAEKEARYPGSTKVQGRAPQPRDIANLTLQMLDESSDELDLMKKLKAQGLKLTQENVSIIKQTLDARRQHAAQESGADQQ